MKAGKVTVPFLRILRSNISYAKEVKQEHRLQAFRFIQKEVRALLEQMTADPPPCSGAAAASGPQRLKDADVLDASPLRLLLLEEESGMTSGGFALQRRKDAAARVGDLIAERLAQDGFAVLEGLFDAAVVAGAREELGQLEPHMSASEIWVGEQAGAGAQMVMPSVRSDRVLWLCGHHRKEDRGGDDVLEPCEAKVKDAMTLETAQGGGGARHISADEIRARQDELAYVLDGLDAVVDHLKNSPKAGRFGGLAERGDTLAAVYPGTGARFQKHVDNTARDGRRLSVMCYLNEQAWEEKHGGELWCYPAEDKRRESREEDAVAIAPLSGRVVLLAADKTPHEVRPSFRHRYSIVVWYQDTEERARAKAEAAKSGGHLLGSQGGAAEATSAADQAASRAFLQALLAGKHAQAAGGGYPGRAGAGAEAELRDLAERAAALEQNPGAVAMAAKVVLGSHANAKTSAADLARAIRELTPAGLKQLRENMSLSGASA
eukprot:TRINITY_DN45222_c0_g1_i1.p1 TRINITY_DN45222_c0_g1~~TRINITY_DN45222_c0_g1_i1.p1  ORF type:complete len:492 (-),score=144.60 TRINITY_DN45222_c0_g1_i1:107-1582(-)